MRKYFMTLMLVLMAFVMPLQAQNQKLKLAVYATGNVDALLKNIAQNNASTELVNGGRYQMIERSAEFLKFVSEEQNYQRSGAVDDGQIAELGKQYGAQCVCVVDITHIDSYLYVATRMIDVVAATSQRAGDAENTNYATPADLRKCVTEAVKKMEGGNTGATSQYSYNKSNKINGHEYVDLGLSVKWATCNVGTLIQEGYGDYLNYSQACSSGWGGGWRLPNKAELEELKVRCTWTWTTQNGVKGYKVTGPNGNSIFLPAAGYRNGSSLYYVGSYGYYWSSTPYDSSLAWSLYFNSGAQSLGRNYRSYGRSVRLVAE